MSRLAELLYGLRHPGGQTRGFYNVRRAGWARRYGKDLDDDARDELLAAREDEEALTRHAKAGNEYAAALLAAVLYDGEDEHGLARHAKAGNSHAAARLAELLDDRGDEDGLARHAKAGNSHAAWALADLLDDRGDEDGLDSPRQGWQRLRRSGACGTTGGPRRPRRPDPPR
jgi:hypothetical protein